ncbi:Centromere protein J [Chlorella vulgaris]
MQEPSSATMPFLRRGSGWEARTAAAREGRRYVPRGGPVKDYTKEEESPVLARRRRAAAASRLSRSPSKPAHSKPGPVTSSTMQRAARSLSRGASCAARAPSAAAQPKQPARACATAAGSKDWGKDMFGGSSKAGASQGPAAEVQALQEFEALECQVLAEAGNARLRLIASRLPVKQADGRAAAAEVLAQRAVGAADGGEHHGSRAASCAVSASVGGSAELEEEEEELSAESSFVSDLHLPSLQEPQLTGRPHAHQSEQLAAMHAGAEQRQATQQPSRLQQPRPHQQQVWPAHSRAGAGQGTEAEAVEELQQAVMGVQEERARAARLRLELEHAKAQLGQDRDAFEQQKREEAAQFEAQRLEELRKLQRDRRVLEKQSRAVLKMPTKQSKEEVAAVEALLAEERRIGRAREARHKLTVERLRQQMLELEACNCELRQQVQCLEQQVVAREWGSAASCAGVAAAATTAPPLPSIVAERPEAGVTGGSTGNSPSAAGEERPSAAQEPAQPSGACSPPATATAARASQYVDQQENAAQQLDAGQGLLEAAGSRPGAVRGALDLQLDACTQQSALEASQQGAAGHSSSTWSTSACIPASCAKIVETGDAVASTAQAGDCPTPALGHMSASVVMHRQPAEGKPGSPDDLRRIGQSLLAGAAAGQQSPVAAAPSSLGRSSGGSAAGDKVLSEVQHADGRTERTHASGLLEVHFANGSTQRSLPSGAKLTRFSNGDVKRVLSSGVVEYLYAEVDSWQVTHPSGVEVFFFPSGQVEAHHPGGIKEVFFADGLVRKMLPDGRELAISAAHLSREIQLAVPEDSSSF